jgi:DNA-binding IclR family transcriptional regulator
VKARPSGTVGKAFRLLDELSHSPSELLPRELSQQTGLDRTTVYRLLETLLQIGVVARDASTGRYRLGLRTLDYASAALDTMEVRHVALSHLIELERDIILAPDEVECSIFVAVLDGLDVVLVEVGWTRSVFARTGGRMRFPAYASAAGRCILAYMPDAERQQFLGERHLEPRTPRTLTTLSEILCRLEHIRTLGYDTSDREVFPDLVALAVPVLGRSGTALASIGLSAPATGTSLERIIERYSNKLLVAAQRTGMALRYRD